MIQFYAPEISMDHALPQSDSQHCVKVLRMKAGDIAEVVDGKGRRYKCRITDANPKKCLVEILEESCMALPWKKSLTLAVAPTKQIDRMEWMVEKLTEIGVDCIVPLLCAHSERKEIKTERLEKIAVAAMKQSLKAFVPRIWPMTPFKEAILKMQAGQKFILHCDSETIREQLCDRYSPATDAIMLIGPEGDFSKEEIALALEAGYASATLGENRLRTETAAVAACHTCHVINQINKME